MDLRLKEARAIKVFFLDKWVFEKLEIDAPSTSLAPSKGWDSIHKKNTE